MTGRRLLLFFLAVASAQAQFGSGLPTINHRVFVHVNFSNGGDCDVSTQVSLIRSHSTAQGRESTDKSCTVAFFGVPPGTYYLSVSGRGFATFESSEVVLTSPDTESLEVNVTRPATAGSVDTTLSSAMVTVADLRIPKPAAKEFNKASEQMEGQNWKAATATLKKAIEIYPQYAAAYNNLGVAYARSGNRDLELEALQKAIEIESHFIPAYVNLARLKIAENAFPDAETVLGKVRELDPANGIALVLLAYAEYMDHHWDDAIAACRKVHAMGGGVSHSAAHWVAAFAFEEKKQLADASAEFQSFVSEEKTGIRSDAARREIANIASFLSEKP
jgi:tetratricopeptide (TPR) repeat protein